MVYRVAAVELDRERRYLREALKGRRLSKLTGEMHEWAHTMAYGGDGDTASARSLGLFDFLRVGRNPTGHTLKVRGRDALGGKAKQYLDSQQRNLGVRPPAAKYSHVDLTYTRIGQFAERVLLVAKNPKAVGEGTVLYTLRERAIDEGIKQHGLTKEQLRLVILLHNDKMTKRTPGTIAASLDLPLLQAIPEYGQLVWTSEITPIDGEDRNKVGWDHPSLGITPKRMILVGSYPPNHRLHDLYSGEQGSNWVVRWSATVGGHITLRVPVVLEDLNIYQMG